MSASGIDRLYNQARDRGRRGQLWSVIGGRSRRLLPLDTGTLASGGGSARHTGLEMIPIGQIRGTESRGSDFDRDFNPLQDHTRARWVGIAAAQLRGKVLPPVELTKVGEFYYVSDGHHRISVARALGQRVIEADVVVYRPRETTAPDAGPLDISVPGRIRERLRRAAEGTARLGERLVLNAQQLAAG